MTSPRQILERFIVSVRRRLRAQRMIGATVIASIATCLVSILPSLFAFAGWAVPWWWAPRELLWAVVVAASVSAFAASWFPIRTPDVARAADRRLGLDGALITSIEVLDSPDPVCRLLVRRTAADVARSRLRRAAPLGVPAVALVVPALATVAVALGSQAPPVVTSPPSESSLTEVAAEVRLSRDLQQSASLLVSVDGPVSETRIATARQLLEIDRSLRGGMLSPAEARALASESVAVLGRESDPSLGRQQGLREEPGSDRPALTEVVADLIGATFPSTDPGQGAGTGSAMLRAGSEGTDDRVSPTAIWALPPPSRSSGAGVTPIGSGDADPDSPGAAERSSWLRTSRLPLTPAERAMVEAYLDRLRRKDEP